MRTRRRSVQKVSEIGSVERSRAAPRQDQLEIGPGAWITDELLSADGHGRSRPMSALAAGGYRDTTFAEQRTDEAVWPDDGRSIRRFQVGVTAPLFCFFSNFRFGAGGAGAFLFLLVFARCV
jgi:hypothetical protein